MNRLAVGTGNHEHATSFHTPVTIENRQNQWFKTISFHRLADDLLDLFSLRSVQFLQVFPHLVAIQMLQRPKILDLCCSYCLP